MTETSPISFQSDVNDPVDVRVSTVGRIQPHCEVKIVDDEGQPVRLVKQESLDQRLSGNERVLDDAQAHDLLSKTDG